MSRQSTGWVLLALAVVGAAAVAGLTWAHGYADAVLVVIAAGGVLTGVLVVVGDVRRRRRLEALDAARSETALPG